MPSRFESTEPSDEAKAQQACSVSFVGQAMKPCERLERPT